MKRIRRHEVDAIAEVAAMISRAFPPDFFAIVVNAAIEMKIRVSLPAEQRLSTTVPPRLDPLVNAEADEMLPFQTVRFIEEIKIFAVMGRIRRIRVVYI